MAKHAEIHAKGEEYQKKQPNLKRALVIWSWWFGVIVAFVVDAIAFLLIDDVLRTPMDMAKYLAMWALATLIIGIIAVYIPWRSWIGWTDTLAHSKAELTTLDALIETSFENQAFIGGWFEAGKIEASLLLAAIVMGIHSIALAGAGNRDQAGFILIVTAMVWTLMASWQLQRALLAENALELARKDVGLNQDVEVAYSDDDESSGLLTDDNSGLRGRPDQIVIVDGEFIPVEQKTGKVPKKPHDSHKMQLLAYIHLVQTNTGRTPPYGVLRYGKEGLHQVYWDDQVKEQLFDAIKEVQRLMVENDAQRNHERPGKCQHCSRRYACEQSLVQKQDSSSGY